MSDEGMSKFPALIEIDNAEVKSPIFMNIWDIFHKFPFAAQPFKPFVWRPLPLFHLSFMLPAILPGIIQNKLEDNI